MYKTILFDFDGTVFDTGEGILKSVQYAAEAFGYHEPELEALRCFVGPPLVESFMRRYGVDEATGRAMTARYRERYSKEGLNECSVYPGVPELVERLKKSGRKVVIATGKPTKFTVDILERNGLGGLFNGAKKCGIPCIGVAWGYAEPGELLSAGAIYLAETVDELENILTR